MYLDTLKVSTLEQTAEQTSARGGVGNPELIIWDYGKEISLSLEDALYTPASQSLMWGGKFGIKKPKVQGLWNPLVYPKDEYGRITYLEKKVLPNYTNGYFTYADGTPIRELPNSSFLYYGRENDTVVRIRSASSVTPYISAITAAMEQDVLHNAITGEEIEVKTDELTTMKTNLSSLVFGRAPQGAYFVVDAHGIPQNPEIPATDLGEITEYAPSTVVSFICPCDGSIKTVQFVPAKGEYKYESLDGFAAGYKCPKGYDTGERDTAEDNEARLVKTYYWNIGDNAIVDGLTKAKADHPKTYKGRPERAEIAIDNYGSFDFSTFDMKVLNGVEEDAVITIDADQEHPTHTDQFCIYTPIPKCDGIVGDSATACGSSVAAYGYEWNKVDMKMTSFEGDQDIYYLENANLRYRVPRNSTQKEIMIGRTGFYETVYDADKDPQWVKANEEEIVNIMELTRQNTQRESYGYFVNPYDATVDFFMNIELALPVDNNKSIKRFVRVPLGRFYIIADWNFGGDTPYDLIHPIKSGIENVHVLDRMEKCKASQTFAIDANKNLAMANYRYMQEYSEAPLTVYIDPKTMKPYEPNSGSFTRQNGDVITGNLRIIKQYEVYYKWTRTIAPPYTTLGHRIIVDAQHFPGAYRIVGETFARGRADGKDQRYQFEIPLAKLSPETNLTLQADGDPTTFTMNFKVLRRDDGVMMKLTQYNVDCNTYDGYTSGSTKVVPTDTIEDNTLDTVYSSVKEAAIRLVKPPETTRELAEELDGDVTVSEDISAVLDTSTTTTAETYNMQTLQPVDTVVTRTENTEELTNDEYNVRVENLDKEVGE